MRRKDLEKLANENKVLRGALREYANPDNWDSENGQLVLRRVDINVARRVLEIDLITISKSVVSGETVIADNKKRKSTD